MSRPVLLREKGNPVDDICVVQIPRGAIGFGEMKLKPKSDKTPHGDICPHIIDPSNRCDLKRHLDGNSRYCQKDNSPRNSQNSEKE